MSLPVVLRAEAGKDAEQARNYLESQRPGCGQVFLTRLKEVLDSIGRMPEMYSVIWQDVRAARVRKFRYVVYYRVHEHRIEVLAILHGSRDAPEWQRRV